jgi:hypothetical protein
MSTRQVLDQPGGRSALAVWRGHELSPDPFGLPVRAKIGQEAS